MSDLRHTINQVMWVQNILIENADAVLESYGEIDAEVLVDFIENIETTVYEVLINSSYLSAGAYKTVFVKDGKIYAFCHHPYGCDNDPQILDYADELTSPIWPDVTRVCDRLFSMPKYAVLEEEEMNKTQRAIFDALFELDYLNDFVEYDEYPDLPEYIVDGLNELLERGVNLSPDYKSVNLGWNGDVPILFDFFTIDV